MASDSWIRRAWLLRIQSWSRDVILEWAWRDYPLYLLPRFIAQSAPAVTAIPTLCVTLNSRGLLPPTPCADQVINYSNAAHWYRDGDRLRAARQWVKFEANETELAYRRDGTPLDFPSGTGAQVPSVPVLFTRDHVSRDKGVSDPLPTVPTPLRDR